MKAEDKQAFRALLKSKSGINVTLVNIKAKYTLKKHDWDSKTIVQVHSQLISFYHILRTTYCVAAGGIPIETSNGYRKNREKW